MLSLLIVCGIMVQNAFQAKVTGLLESPER